MRSVRVKVTNDLSGLLIALDKNIIFWPISKTFSDKTLE